MFKWLTVAPYNEELDILGLYCYGYDAENFSVYLDDIYYESLLNNDTFEIFSLEDCKIDKEEYVQSFVIRKNLEKIYYNTLMLNPCLFARFRFKGKEKFELALRTSSVSAPRCTLASVLRCLCLILSLGVMLRRASISVHRFSCLVLGSSWTIVPACFSVSLSVFFA